MPSVRRGHPGDGTQPCCRVRSDEQLALPEIDARKIPTEEQLDLLRGRQGACRRHLLTTSVNPISISGPPSRRLLTTRLYGRKGVRPSQRGDMRETVICLQASSLGERSSYCIGRAGLGGLIDGFLAHRGRRRRCHRGCLGYCARGCHRRPSNRSYSRLSSGCFTITWCITRICLPVRGGDTVGLDLHIRGHGSPAVTVRTVPKSHPVNAQRITNKKGPNMSGLSRCRPKASTAID